MDTREHRNDDVAKRLTPSILIPRTGTGTDEWIARGYLFRINRDLEVVAATQEAAVETWTNRARQLLDGVGVADPVFFQQGTPRHEAINHPSHYGGADNPYEVIKVMEVWLSYEEFVGAMKFNIHKYLARASKKGRAEEDAGKAAWYAEYLADYQKRKKP